MKILALDLATKTGWAFSDGPSGMQDFKLKRGESSGMKWIHFRAWLMRMVKETETDLIVYEQAHHRGGAATHSGHAFIAIVETVTATTGIELTWRHSSAIKKHALGEHAGKRNKEAMVKQARINWPDVEIIDDNHADALWLLDLVQTELAPGGQ